MSDIRRELVNAYCSLYSERNTTNVKQFSDNYTKLSELWLSMNDQERNAINTRLFSDGHKSY